jgi:hypothetical protein
LGFINAGLSSKIGKRVLPASAAAPSMLYGSSPCLITAVHRHVF